MSSTCSRVVDRTVPSALLVGPMLLRAGFEFLRLQCSSKFVREGRLGSRLQLQEVRWVSFIVRRNGSHHVLVATDTGPAPVACVTKVDAGKKPSSHLQQRLGGFPRLRGRCLVYLDGTTKILV